MPTRMSPSPIPLERTVTRRPAIATTRVPPNALLMLLEGRAPIEFFSLLAALPWLRACRAATVIR